jgi:hypothetical protein
MSNIISVAFWIIWSVFILLGIVEAVTYSGFVPNHIGVSMYSIVVIVGLLAVPTLLLRLMRKNTTFSKGDRIASVFFIVVLTLYVILKVANRLTYPGFVFSRVHIDPNSLISLVLISLAPVVVAWAPRINIKQLVKIQSVLVILAFSIIALNLYTIYKSEWKTFQLIVAHPNATYDDKMRKAIGDVFYNYSLFVNKYTAPSASLLVPPQAFPWPGSGNVGYFRYFVYPRNIINGDEFEPPLEDILARIDYVLLNWGETDIVEPPHTHDWPKFDVKAEKIIFMNKDGSFGGEVKGDYRYEDYKDKKVWGLIVVKH